MNSKNRLILSNFVIFEFILLNAILFSFFLLTVPEFKWISNNFIDYFTSLLIINLSNLLIILYVRVKDFYFNPDYRFIKYFAFSFFILIGIVSTLSLIFQNNYFTIKEWFVPIFIFSYINLLIHRYLLKFLRLKGPPKLILNALVISSSKEYPNLLKLTNNFSARGYKILGYLSDKSDKNSLNGIGRDIIGTIKDLPDILQKYAVDEIFITMSSLKEKKIKSSVKIADSFGIRVKLVPENPTFIARNYKADKLGDIAVFQLRQSPLDNFGNAILKRLFDFCFALLAIIFLSPLFLLIALLIYIDQRGPILYAPYRKGEGGGTFKCYKFRTMSVCDDPINGTKSTVPNDPRITSIGRLLRKSDLDEIPQFFNVLIGEMSVIGPRPHRTNLQNDFRKIVNDYMVRSYVKPGITGWAQVNGWRGPTVTHKQKKERVKHDLWYIENWSFLLDIKIIFLTIFGQHKKNAF